MITGSMASGPDEGDCRIEVRVCNIGEDCLVVGIEFADSEGDGSQDDCDEKGSTRVGGPSCTLPGRESILSGDGDLDRERPRGGDTCPRIDVKRLPMNCIDLGGGAAISGAATKN